MRATAAAAFLLAASVCVQGQSAKERFLRGKELIETNGPDSMGATRHGFEQGIAEVRKAIGEGYEDQIAAYKVLAEAYNDLALVYAQPDSKEQSEIFLLQRQALEKLLELAPGDARIRADYARLLKDVNAEIEAWRDVVADEPNNAEARWRLGVLLVHEGQIDEGMTQLRKMVELADLYPGQTYASVARDHLIDKSRTAEAAEISRLMQKKMEPSLLPKHTVEKLSRLQPGNRRQK